MQFELRKHLEDMRQAAERISRFVEDFTFEQYTANDLVRSAVERQFQILGEALRRLERLAPDTAATISESKRILSFCNLLVHGYDVVDDRVVWDVIQIDLRKLYGEVVDLLQSMA